MQNCCQEEEEDNGLILAGLSLVRSMNIIMRAYDEFGHSSRHLHAHHFSLLQVKLQFPPSKSLSLKVPFQL